MGEERKETTNTFQDKKRDTGQMNQSQFAESADIILYR